MKEKGKSVPASGGEDACSADGFSPIASLYLPSVFTCLRVPFVFSAAFEAEKMMKRPACWEFVLRCFFFCAEMSAEMKAMAGTILCVCWFPFLSFSLCVISFSGFLLCFYSGSDSVFCSGFFFVFLEICIYSARIPSCVRYQVSIKLILFFEV